LTYELREALAAAAPARVVTVASFGHKLVRKFAIADLPTLAWQGETAMYGASKLCNIWFAREAARRMAGTGVTSNSLHPGAVASNFGASGSWLMSLGMKLAWPFLISPAKGARTSIYLASSPEVAGVTGEYFSRCKVRTPSKRARADGSAKELWELSERLCGVRWP
jgi:NAD(P)-dependent dehydrogenase (short-subunit alcohol dehydrogenase family)